MLLPRDVSPTQPTLADYVWIHNVDCSELAKTIGCSTRTVRSWIEGRRCPQLAKAREFARALGVSEGEIANMLAATWDARNECPAKRAVRTAMAAFQRAKSQPRDFETRLSLLELSNVAKRLGKPRRLVVRRGLSANDAA
jgi:DNA-binding transcriptional regulator YiaG